MSAPARPTAAELERHHCRLGHRLVRSSSAVLMCIDCGADLWLPSASADHDTWTDADGRPMRERPRCTGART